MVVSNSCLVNLHCHKTITCQPACISSSWFRWSRSRLRLSFACQKAVLVLGRTNLLATLLNKEFYVCSANLHAALTPRNVQRTFLRCGLTASSETAINEDSRSELAHDYIRFARYALDVQTIPISV